jgi:hypothetical protein
MAEFQVASRTEAADGYIQVIGVIADLIAHRVVQQYGLLHSPRFRIDRPPGKSHHCVIITLHRRPGMQKRFQVFAHFMTEFRVCFPVQDKVRFDQAGYFICKR